MPIKLPPKEERFVQRHVLFGATDDPVKIREAERLSRWVKGSAARLLKLVRVQNRIAELMAPVLAEQAAQKAAANLIDQATSKLQAEKAELEEKLAAATQMPLMLVTGNRNIIEQELMRLVRLDPERHGRIKLQSIQTALVVDGLVEQGTFKRVAPPDSSLAAAAGVYQNLFDR